jgi:serine/threonine-protein kinase
MGAVYRAMQLSMGRAVALKILRPRFANNLEQVRRFQTEARAVSKLEHPHTIRVYDFGQSASGELYLVTELLEGEPLSALMAREQVLAPNVAVRIACQTLKALSEAHANHIVHRDLKPENIFLKRVHGEPSFIKVLDFGIAKLTTDGQDSSPSVTTTGAVVGTPLYMAPEQASGGRVSPVTDLYALGTVLYEMLSGRPPFEGETPMAVMMAHIQSPLAPLRLGDRDPRLWELADIVSECLEKDPARRPESADVLRRRLVPFLTLGEAQAPTELRRAPQPEPVGDRATLGDAVIPRDASTPASVTMEAAAMAGIRPNRGRRVVAGLFALLLIAVGALWEQTVPLTTSGLEAPSDVARIQAPAPSVGGGAVVESSLLSARRMSADSVAVPRRGLASAPVRARSKSAIENRRPRPRVRQRPRPKRRVRVQKR